MKLGIVGSRDLSVDLAAYVPDDCTLIVSGGASGIDRCAAEYARAKSIDLVEYLPNFARFRAGATLRRNDQIVDAVDRVLAFWDGRSRGTKYTIERCRTVGRRYDVFVWNGDRFTPAP